MIVVDTSVVVAIIREEDDAAHFINILDGTTAIISVVSYVETQMVIAGRNLQSDPRKVADTISSLGIEIVDVNGEQAGAAIDAFFRFGKGRHCARLNLADCFAYALAKSRGIPILFKGDDFTQTDIVAARPT
ncbi:MAG: type II toxin-antitoxin system VapC family toxin [Xanthobacteraceae bacterium]